MMSEAAALAAPAEGGGPQGPSIDWNHLARMTFGDPRLEREVLQLFLRQSGLLRGRMGQARPSDVVALAHTMKGSAQGVGAWQVAAAAEAVERAAAGVGASLPAALARLDAALSGACGAIEELLRAA